MTHYLVDALVRPLRSGRWAAVVILAALFGPAMAQTNTQLASDVGALKKVPFEELFNLEITTVSKRPERLVDAASAVQVITSEEIRRSGATSLPEALRLASNLQVAQVNSSTWAISARGFNATTANKLLVLIDGRTVYTPLFSGVFWDVQNVMLEDVDRIEVISGPGATLWGANAVNGVINVITKTARDTQGALLSGGGGSFLRGFGNARYGDKIGQDVYFRLYGMGFDRDNALLPSGRDATNNWFLGQGGFRADWLPPGGTRATLQGDFYGGEIAQTGPGDVTVDGQNLIGRWTHPLAGESDLTVQVYWDRTRRRIPNSITEVLNTYDIEFDHRLPLGERNRFIWGGGYRLMHDEVDNAAPIAFLPGRRDLHLFSAFVQDEITLLPERMFLTIGSKFEHNDYSGFEFQPSVRIAWTPVTDQTLWAAVSRAVRSPSRIDTEIFAPSSPPFILQGGGDRFDSETVLAYELGYRTELAQRLGLSISTFFNDYDDIRSVEPIAGAPGQFIILNGLRAKTYGVELSATWQPLDRWRLRGGYTYFRKEIRLGNSLDINRGRGEGNDPHHQFLLHSMVNLPADLEFDSVLRYVDNLNQRGPTVPSYVALDLRLGWRPTPNWEFAIVGQNLLDKQHPEFGAPATRQEIPRSVYGKVTWKFWTGNNGAK
ncbi:MAG: TonB-dependent receptor [Deltaproteobacteria bacterium]|nr:TonB-dependent receptor [Deltaproteobacteria bacterium]